MSNALNVQGFVLIVLAMIVWAVRDLIWMEILLSIISGELRRYFSNIAAVQIWQSPHKTLKNIMHHCLAMAMVTCKILGATIRPIKVTSYKRSRNQDIDLN